MNHMISNLAVIGLGKLGAPLAALLASKGFQVIGVDADQGKVDLLNQRKPPVYEPGLAELLQTTQLQATTNLRQALNSAQVIFVIVPTPSQADGSFSLNYILKACEEIGRALKENSEFKVVVVTSTVMPGHMERNIRPVLEMHSNKKCSTGFGLCYNPEFVALGSVLHDISHPSFVLIGESDKKSGDILSSVYQRMCDNQPPIERMSFVNAELAKLAVNTFVTTKITFANMLARLCELLPGSNVDTVTSALGRDMRIGSKYLKGAIGYGGPCFPRDNLALTALARSLGTSALLAEATDSFNRNLVEWLGKMIEQHLPKRGRVGILGLVYKPNSDVIEESQGLLVAQYLAKRNIPVSVYDPLALDKARQILDKKTNFFTSPLKCIQASDVVVVATPWDEFKQLKHGNFKRLNRPRVVIDCWRILDQNCFGKGVKRLSLGIGQSC